MKLKMILATLALVASVGAASAQSDNTQKKCDKTKKCHLDKNNDGVCDKKAEGIWKKGEGKEKCQDGAKKENCDKT